MEEAGGRFTDLGGTPTPAGGSVVSSNGLLHLTPGLTTRLVAWLCTDEAAWVTGQVINSEGGFRRYS